MVNLIADPGNFGYVGRFTSGSANITGIQVNEVISHEARKLSLDIASGRSVTASGSEDPILLPFFDDFSTSNIFPNQKLWNGYSVFINKDFAYMPVNTGAATLDAIDSKFIPLRFALESLLKKSSTIISAVVV